MVSESEAIMDDPVVHHGEPTAELIREALDETRELVRLEVALARHEMKAELMRAKAGGVALGAAAGLALSGLTMFFVAIANAFAMVWLAALLIGVILTCLAAMLALGGWMSLPKEPMVETRERLATDLKGLRERIA